MLLRSRKDQMERTEMPNGNPFNRSISSCVPNPTRQVLRASGASLRKSGRGRALSPQAGERWEIVKFIMIHRGLTIDHLCARH